MNSRTPSCYRLPCRICHVWWCVCVCTVACFVSSGWTQVVSQSNTASKWGTRSLQPTGSALMMSRTAMQWRSWRATPMWCWPSGWETVFPNVIPKEWLCRRSVWQQKRQIFPLVETKRELQETWKLAWSCASDSNEQSQHIKQCTGQNSVHPTTFFVHRSTCVCVCVYKAKSLLCKAIVWCVTDHL